MHPQTIRHARRAVTAAGLALSFIVLAAVYSANGGALAQAIRPGTIPTKADGYTLRAKVAGKEWTAASMMPLEVADRVIGYRGDAYIGFALQARSATVGRHIAFSDNNAADLSVQGDDAAYGGRAGEMVITKADAQWIEGTFHFSATSQSSGSKKTIEVTDGFFRVAMPKR